MDAQLSSVMTWRQVSFLPAATRVMSRFCDRHHEGQSDFVVMQSGQILSKHVQFPHVATIASKRRRRL